MCFKVGDLVTIVRNSERTFAFSFVGRRGRIIDFDSRYAVVQVGKNKHDIVYIVIEDLEYQDDDRDLALLQ